MAQVPYQPIPEERPSGQPLSIATPPEAFGVGIAKAVAGFGQDVEKASADIYSRAVEMQKLKIEADVNEKVTQNFLERGDLDNKFRTLQGKDPQEQLELHRQALQQSREKGRAEVGSSYGQKLYDQQTMRQFGYDVVNAGNYAATELKKYGNQTRSALTGTLSDNTARDPYNDQLATDNATQIRDLQRKNFQGMPDEIATRAGDLAVGGMVKSRALAMDPDRATQMLETWKGEITPDDYKEIKDAIRTQARSKVVDRNVADAAADKQQVEAQDEAIYKTIQNARMPPDKQDPALSRAALVNNPLFKNRPKDLENALTLYDKALDNTIDPTLSRSIADGVSANIKTGKITTQDQLNEVGRNLPVTADDLKTLKTELKERENNPAVRQFHAAISTWVRDNASQIDRKMVSPDTGVIDPTLRTSLGQKMIERWQAEVDRRAKIEIQNNRDPYELLNPNSPNSMTSPEALQPYRVTSSAAQKYEAEQRKIDAAAGIPTGVPKAPPMVVPPELRALPNLQRNLKTREFWDKDTNTYYDEQGNKLKERKTGAQKMSFAGEDEGPQTVQGVIDAALQNGVDAHLDKNLFSSGRAERQGISGGIGKNMTSITSQGQTVQVNSEAAPHFRGFLQELKARGYEITSLGGYNPRMKRGSFSSYSEHAFGNALDINPEENPFRSQQTDLPKDISQIAAKYGLIWGGNWRGSSSDPMHFEWSGKGIARTTRI